MLQNRTIIIFGDDWGRFPSTIQHIGRIFSRYNLVIWIGSLGLRKPMFRFSDIKRLWIKGKSVFLKSSPAVKNTKIIFLNPLVIPWHDLRLVRKFNFFFLKRSLVNLLSKIKAENPIIFTSSPVMASIIGKIGESSSYYFCLDDYSLFDRAFRCLKELESEIINKVSCSFFISDKLRDDRAPGKNSAVILTQGIDLNHFQQDIKPAQVKLRFPEKPVIGFHGLLAEWFDKPLIELCARSFPEINIVVIGKQATEGKIIFDEPNVTYLGEIPYQDLPSYIALFDVGLIPFIINPLTIASNPLKLFEYMNFGIPVVSTNLPEVRKFDDVVYVGNNAKEFVSFVGVALLESSIEKRKKRFEIASRFSWEKVVESICERIDIVECEHRSQVQI